MSDTTHLVGRRAKTQGAQVAGIVSCIPSRRVTNAEFVNRFGEASINEVIRMIGVEQRHQVEAEITTADLCAKGAERLLTRLEWPAESVDGILFFSQTPDFRLPATACALHGRLGLAPGAVAFDVNLGCSAYPYALWLAMTMVQTGVVDRILVAVGDTISRTVDPNDRATALLFGDAGTVTAIERSDSLESKAHFLLGTDGAGARNLIIPQGGFKDGMQAKDVRFNDRRPDCLFMDGGEIFNFTLRAVPPLIAATLDAAQRPMEGYDAFLFHQANTFMIKHLVKKSRLPLEKVPINMDRYGNCSSASIPLLMTTDLAKALSERRLRLGLFGFGVGYSWASAALEIGPLRCVETIES